MKISSYTFLSSLFSASLSGEVDYVYDQNDGGNDAKEEMMAFQDASPASTTNNREQTVLVLSLIHI